MPFYKKLLNKKLVLQDIEYVDPEMYTSLAWLRYVDEKWSVFYRHVVV